MRQVASMGPIHEAAAPRPCPRCVGRVDVDGTGGAAVWSAPRRSAVGSLLALPVADVAAMLACFVAGGLLNFSFRT